MRLKVLEEDEKEIQEVTASPATAKDVSVHAETRKDMLMSIFAQE